MTIKAFPKIFSVGHREIPNLFTGPVEITEKIDGSQFAFGNIDGKFIARSKGVVLEHEPQENDMFHTAWKYAEQLYAMIGLPPGWVFYCEYLRVPKHNTLAYGRTPKNNLMLFGICVNGEFLVPSDRSGEQTYIEVWADILGIEPVPTLYSGEVKNFDELHALLDRKSVLGTADVEGFVVKNYAQPVLIGGQYLPLSAGKFVSEKFKEKHSATWAKEHTTGGHFEVLKAKYRSNARWEKAIQHMRDAGLLEGSPRDIGALIKEVQRDLLEEERASIEHDLFKIYGGDVVKNAIRGLPEWYKERLAAAAFPPCPDQAKDGVE